MGERWDSVAGPNADDPLAVTVAADERTLPRHALDAAVRGSAERLRRCYQDGLRREPGLAGQLPVRLSVDPGGRVILATDAGSTVADPAVVRCVLSAFATMTFGARAGTDVVSVTYVVALPFD
jgi:hypothetical protein